VGSCLHNLLQWGMDMGTEGALGRVDTRAGDIAAGPLGTLDSQHAVDSQHFVDTQMAAGSSDSLDTPLAGGRLALQGTQR
jgi:hypothetical protein